MKKIIGIIMRPGVSESGYNTQIIYNSIQDKITNLGGLVIGIPVTNNIDDIYTIIDMCNGIIIQGGDDVREIDIDIIKYLYDKDIPTLAICLGMQEMALAFNGELSDLDSNNHLKKDIDYVHEIIINKTSNLYKIINNKKIKVNSRHKSYVSSTDLDISAYSRDNIIEGIECKHKKFFIGVEWHPESLNDNNSLSLFKALLEGVLYDN